MKKHNGFLQRTTFALTFFVVLLLIVNCRQGNDKETQKQTTSSSPATPEVPKADIHTAAIPVNMDYIKQYIGAGFILNEKNPIGASSPLIFYYILFAR